MKKFASTQNYKGSQKGNLAAKAMQDNYMRISQEQDDNEDNKNIKETVLLKPLKGLITQYLSSECGGGSGVNSQKGLNPGHGRIFSSIASKKNMMTMSQNFDSTSGNIWESQASTLNVRSSSQFQQSIGQPSNSNHLLRRQIRGASRSKNETATDKEIAQLLKSNLDLPSDLVSTLKSSIVSNSAKNLLSKQRSTKTLKINSLKKKTPNDILKMPSQPTSTSSLRQPTSQSRMARQTMRAQSNLNLQSPSFINALPEIESNSKLLLPNTRNRLQSQSSNYHSGSSSNLVQSINADYSPQQAQRMNRNAQSTASLALPRMPLLNSEQINTEEDRQHSPEVLISINTNNNIVQDHTLAPQELKVQKENQKTKKMKAARKLIKQQHKSMKQLLKYKKDKLMNEKYQMYGKQSHNNEILNILKEERLFQNLSNKQSRDLKKLKEVMTQKMIEELIRDRIQQSLPNSNQLESIIQDVLHNRHRNSNNNPLVDAPSADNQPILNQSSNNKEMKDQLFRSQAPRQNSKNRRLQMREQYVNQQQQQQQPLQYQDQQEGNQQDQQQLLVQHYHPSQAMQFSNKKSSLANNQQESNISVSDFMVNESDEDSLLLEQESNHNQGIAQTISKKQTFSHFSPMSGRSYQLKSINRANTNNVVNIQEYTKKRSRRSNKGILLQLPAYDLDKPRTQKVLVRLPSNGSENSHTNLNSNSNNNYKSKKSRKSGKKIAVVNGKKMQVIQRKKLNCGTGGWPKLITQTAKKIREESVMMSPHLKRTNTDKNSFTTEYSSSSSSIKDEDVKFFKWQVDVCKYMSKEIKKIGQAKQFSCKKGIKRAISGFQSISKHNNITAQYNNDTFAKNKYQFGLFTNFSNDNEAPIQQQITHQKQMKAHNRINYETKTQIICDDRFRPVNRSPTRNINEIKPFTFTEEELLKEGNFGWHHNLEKKFPNMREIKEIKLRQEGKPWQHDRCVKAGTLMVDLKRYNIHQLRTHRIIRQSSTVIQRLNHSRVLKGELFTNKTDRDFVPRHIVNLNVQKYKELLAQQQQNQSRSFNSASPKISNLKQMNKFNFKKQEIRLTKFQRRSKKNLLEGQFKASIPKPTSQNANPKVDLRKVSKLFKEAKIKVSNNSSLFKSSSEDQTLSKNFDIDSEQFEKIEMTPIAGDASYQQRFDSDNQANINLYSESTPTNTKHAVKSGFNHKISQIAQLSNHIKLLKSANKQPNSSSPQVYNTAGDGKVAKGGETNKSQNIKHKSNISQEKGSLAMKVMQQKFNSVLVMSGGLKKSHTFINLPQLCQIENNMDKKEKEDRLLKEQTVVNMMEEGINLMQSTKKNFQSPDAKANLKKAYPQNYLHPFKKEIISKIRSEINIDLLRFLKDADINWEMHLDNINHIDFSIHDDCYYQLQYVEFLKVKRSKEAVTIKTFNEHIQYLLLRPDLGNPNYNQQTKKFDVEYNNLVRDCYLCSFEKYAEHSVRKQEYYYKNMRKEKTLGLFHKNMKKFNLKQSITNDNQHFMRIHCYHINSFSQKQLLDIFYRPNLPNQLFNRLHRKLDWTQLEKNKDKIILAMPPQYISDYKDFVKLKQNEAQKHVNPAVTVSKNRRKNIIAVRFVSSTKHFSYKFDSLESPHEFKLLNNFIYFSMLERMNPSLSCEMFAYGLNPKIKRQMQEKYGNGGEAMQKSNSEIDSYNMLQHMALGHETSFVSTNTIKTNIQVNNLEQKFRKNLMLAGVTSNTTMDFGSLVSKNQNRLQLYKGGSEQIQYSLKRSAFNQKQSTTSFNQGPYNYDKEVQQQNFKDQELNADEYQFTQLRKMQSLAFQGVKQLTTQENNSLLPLPANSNNRAVFMNKSLSGGIVRKSFRSSLDAVTEKNSKQAMTGKPSQLTEMQLSDRLSQNSQSRSQDRSQANGINIQKKLLGFQISFEGIIKPQKTMLYKQETINEEAGTPQHSKLDIQTSPYKIALNLIAADSSGGNKQDQFNSPSVGTKSRFLTTEISGFKHSLSLQLEKGKEKQTQQEQKNKFGVRDNVYDLENSDISAEDSIISMNTSEDEENDGSNQNSFITYHEEIEGPSERVQMFAEPHVINLIQRQNNLMINIGYNSDGVIIESMHKKVEDQFDTPQPSPTIKDLDNLLPGTNTRKLNTRVNRMMNSTVLRANQVNNSRKKKKKLNMRVESFTESNNIVIMAFQAVKENNFKKVQEMFSRFHGLELEAKDSLGNTLLNVAAQHCCTQIMELLIKNGAFIDTQNKLLNTPLHYAKAYNFTSIVDLLITKGANQNILNSKGQSPWEGIG